MSMRLVVFLGVAIALAGCVGEPRSVAPESEPTASETAIEARPGENTVPEHPTGFVQTDGSFSFEGEAFAGVWVCGVPLPGGCAEHVLSDDAYTRPIPHEGNVSAPA